MKTKSNFIILVVVFVSGLVPALVSAQGKIHIAVAANMQVAMDFIISVYEKTNTGEKVIASYNSSGKFYEQIRNQAPFDIFFSADMDFPERLKDNGFAISPVKLYAVGRITIWSKKIDVASLKMNSFTEASVKKIAIANPATAPYGARSVESMKHYKIYNSVKSKLVFGENIAQTAQFISFGAADVGIIALSEVLSPNLKKEGGTYYVIPDSSHLPLEQGCLLLKHSKGNASATKFLDFFFTEKVAAILSYYGYSQKQKS